VQVPKIVMGMALLERMDVGSFVFEGWKQGVVELWAGEVFDGVALIKRPLKTGERQNKLKEAAVACALR
jgi:hypothetical protein